MPNQPPAGSGTPPGESGHGFGQFFASYQLIQEIGRGGAAHVFRARHIHPQYSERTFALKVLQKGLSRNSPARRLFESEAYVLSMVQHPNIVRIFEAGVEGDHPFIAMEFVSGADLGELLARFPTIGKFLPRPIALHILREVAQALAYAHALKDPDGTPLNLVHRDVNPANIFLSYDGQVKLGDFGVAGVAARAEEEITVGTPGYFAPEQLAGDEVDARADVFSFGAVMYELICGDALFLADTLDETLRINRQAKTPRPSKTTPNIDRDFEAVMVTALQKRAHKRYASGSALLEALRPHAPVWSGMRMAIAGIIRTLFVDKYMEELKMRWGLTGAAADARIGGSVGVHLKHPMLAREVVTALGQLRLEVHRGKGLLDSMRGDRPPAAMIIEVSEAAPLPESLQEVLVRMKHPVPMIAASVHLDDAAMRAAHAMGARDFLTPPIDPRRVQAALWLVTAAGRQTPELTTPTLEDRGGMKVLLFTRDEGLAEQLPVALEAWSYRVETASSIEEALTRSEVTTYHAALFDAGNNPREGRLFAEAFRGSLGMGLVPIVYLCGPGQEEALAGIERTACRPRHDLPVLLASTLEQLRADVLDGRTFTRYTCAFPVELRYSGRSFQGTAADISRGGVFVYCTAMPPLNARVTLRLRLEVEGSWVHATGRVIRVRLPTSASGQKPGVGLELDPMASRDEALLLEFIAQRAGS